MNNEDVRTCTETAIDLLTARATGNEAGWQAAWARVGDDAGRAQLTIYLLCCTLDDVPERVDRTGTRTRPYLTVSREIERKPEGRIAVELISAAHLLNTFDIRGEWQAAWDEADGDVRRSLADAVLRTWRTAIPEERAAMRALLRSLRSLGAPGARRRIRLTTGHYLRLPGNAWRAVTGDAPAGRKVRLERAFVSLRRGHTYDRPAIPEFDRFPRPRVAAMTSR